MTTLTQVSANKMFGGWQKKYTHQATSVNCEMQFSVFLPPQAESGEKLPVLYWLSGLTCTDENFTTKAGAQRIAAELGIMLVIPDTSPRGEGVANDDTYDMGQGAGFYLNATQAPWNKHFHMYDYIVNELPELINANFAIKDGKAAISGHSMGGHGALTIALKNPEKYCSVSAFSPITHPTDCPWGQKAFTGYLGDDKSTWLEYDASLLMKKSVVKIPTLVDQGTGDDFLVEQLKPECLVAAAKENDFPLELRMQDGYDHSYYFMASFIEDHIKFHALYLK